MKRKKYIPELAQFESRLTPAEFVWNPVGGMVPPNYEIGNNWTVAGVQQANPPTNQDNVKILSGRAACNVNDARQVLGFYLSGTLQINSGANLTVNANLTQNYFWLNGGAVDMADSGVLTVRNIDLGLARWENGASVTGGTFNVFNQVNLHMSDSAAVCDTSLVIGEPGGGTSMVSFGWLGFRDYTGVFDLGRLGQITVNSSGWLFFGESVKEGVSIDNLSGEQNLNPIVNHGIIRTRGPCDVTLSPTVINDRITSRFEVFGGTMRVIGNTPGQTYSIDQTGGGRRRAAPAGVVILPCLP